jgi:SPOR domain
LRTFWWLALALFVPFLASGCALPAGVILASYAADSVSYVVTGKSVTDHGLSAVTGHDCALLRPILTQKSICDTAGTERGRHVLVEAGKNLVPRSGTVRATAAPLATEDRYVTVGSYLSPDNALLAKARYAGLKPAIVLVDVGGKRFNRVVVGPLSARAAATLKARLAAG